MGSENMNKRKIQMSESIELGIMLALAGGFMDAYSYICRGEVFANAQTGNMLLFGIHLSQGEWSLALHYLCPVVAFAAGIAISDIVKFILLDYEKIHWRQLAVLFEAVILFAVSFMPQNINLLANSLTSLACGIQVESFRKIHGNGIATTMCIGNLRSGTQNMCEYFHTKEGRFVRKGLLYYGIILCFIVGAVIGNICVKMVAESAIRIASVFLFLVFCMMFIDREKEERQHVRQ